MVNLAELRLDAAVWQISSIGHNDRFIVLNYSNRQRMEQLQRNSKIPIRIVDRSKAYIPIRPQRKPGTKTQPPKNYPEIDIDQPAGQGWLDLCRDVLNF